MIHSEAKPYEVWSSQAGCVKSMILSIAAPLLVLFPTSCFSQSILDSVANEKLIALAEAGASRCLENDASLPKRRVVLTEFTYISVGDEETMQVQGTQIYINDEKSKFRRIKSFGVRDDDEFEYDSLWIGGNRWVFDETQKWVPVYKESAVNKEDGYIEGPWGTAGSMTFPQFDPRYVWTTPPSILELSHQFPLGDFIRSGAIKAARQNSRGKNVSALFATLTQRGVTYITEVSFPPTGMPEQFILYAAVAGEFSVQKAKKSQEGNSPVVNKLKWAEYARDLFVPIEGSQVETKKSESIEFLYDNRWLLGSAVPDWVLKDPRDNHVNLEDLKFDKAVLYSK